MNTHAPPVRLTERERTVLEMLAAGYSIFTIQEELWPEFPNSADAEISMEHALGVLGANSWEHAIALAIRGGHIL